ncbi:3TM-type holin [Desulfocurvus vexinensis]|uniref:3TM-type holin n=1 Tax=Desulfocurvus vexinensis TaxID=399548 RepID=UPI000490204B|nr:3TM-type holin [Desulfocurvus vexinensis]
MSLIGKIGKNLLRLIPGVGQVVTVVDTVADIAGAIGGETGAKIKQGVDLVTEGLREAEAQAPSMTPEQRLALEQAGQRHAERMRELDLDDMQGGRDLSKAEIASSDEYVRRTRPKLLRWVAGGYLALCGLALPLVVAAAVWGDLGDAEADLLVYVVCWLIASVGTMLAAMYRSYTGNRTAEKMADIGQAPEGLLDKLAKLRGSGR